MSPNRHKIKSISYDVYFELDADKLSHNMKSTPIDYWQMDRSHTENEERYLSNKDNLCPAHKYIKIVHVFPNVNNLEHKKYRTNLTEIDWYTSNNKIDTKYYLNINDYLNRKNGLSQEEYVKDKKLDGEDLDWSIIDQNKTIHDNPLNMIIKFYNGDKIPTKVYKKLERVFYSGPDSLYAHEFISKLMGLVHGGRKQIRSSDRNNIKVFVDIMKKHKTRDISKFIKTTFYPDMNKKFKWNHDF